MSQGGGEFGILLYHGHHLGRLLAFKMFAILESTQWFFSVICFDIVIFNKEYIFSLCPEALGIS